MELVYNLLLTTKTKPFTVKSNMARDAAEVIAMLACDGMISTKLPDGRFTNLWMITQNGLDLIEELADEFHSTRH